jgi:hypothetical protein
VVPFGTEQDYDRVAGQVEGGTTGRVCERGAYAGQGGRAARPRGDAERAEIGHRLPRLVVGDGDLWVPKTSAT